MIHVGNYLVASKRSEPAADPHPLLQLAQTRLIQPFVQLGLSHQHNLDELVLIGLKIRKQPELFEHLIA